MWRRRNPSHRRALPAMRRASPTRSGRRGYPLFLAAFLLTPFGFAGAVIAQRILWIAVVGVTAWLCARLTRSYDSPWARRRPRHRDRSARLAGNQLDPAPQTVAAVLRWRGGVAILSSRAIERRRPGRGCRRAGRRVGVDPADRRSCSPCRSVSPSSLPGDGRQRVRAAVILLVTSPARDYRRGWSATTSQTGVATLSSISAINLLRYRAAGTLAIRDAGGVDANLERRQVSSRPTPAAPSKSGSDAIASPCRSPRGRRSTMTWRCRSSSRICRLPPCRPAAAS